MVFIYFNVKPILKVKRKVEAISSFNRQTHAPHIKQAMPNFVLTPSIRFVIIQSVLPGQTCLFRCIADDKVNIEGPGLCGEND